MVTISYIARFLILLILVYSKITAQKNYLLDNLIIWVDSTFYNYKQDKKIVNGKDIIPIEFRLPSETIIFEIKKDILLTIDTIYLEPSSYLHVEWQKLNKDKNSFIAQIKILNIHAAPFFLIGIVYIHNGIKKTEELNIFPTVKMTCNIRSNNEDLYLGEEYLFEINSNFPDNIITVNDWKDSDFFQYRIVQFDKRWYIQFIPMIIGKHQVKLKIPIHKPILENNKFIYHIETNFLIDVRSSQMFFLQITPKEFILEQTSRVEPIIAEIEFHRNLRKNKTYRIENSENKGILIAEIIPIKQISSKKMECHIYLYNVHFQQKGLLYIKDGDDAIFTTNISVLPDASLNYVEISRNGTVWTKNLTVYPGEKIFLRVNGVSLHKKMIHLGNIPQKLIDTIFVSETQTDYILNIPIDINIREIPIQISKKPTQYKIQIREYQRPRQFDYLFVDFGKGFQPLLKISSINFYEKILNDILIQADVDLLDETELIYGKQYINIDVEIYGPRNEILEKITIDNICFCPSSKSKRYLFYDKKDCSSNVIRLNDYLRKKTYTLERWSKITVKISHEKTKYEEIGYNRSFEIILKQNFRVDVDVTFPTGLLVITPNQDKITNFSGISMAMLSQISFYKQNAYARMQPFKVGVGFLALNSFNFSENPSIIRDICIVGLVSFYPVSRESKMAFPLFAGGGYFLSGKSFFWLLGPGIRVSF